MPTHKEFNDTIIGEKIYCVFEKQSTKPKRVSTKGRHNAQTITIKGNPARAIIVKTVRYID
ncbi:hypothetical protein C4E22_02900 [ANME-1 cluster archaeon AG-394-G06]|nr:hypothetical protein [ANME-1 cluster archaeon AG-394-G06]